jgi:hypothetical protein
MPSKLNNRVSRLEKDGHSGGRTFMVWVDTGESTEDAIKRRGVEPGEDDTVLLVGWVGTGSDES